MNQIIRRLRYVCVVAIFATALSNCSRPNRDSWSKPKRVVTVAADVRKALIIASSSATLAKYGHLAGILVEMLPKDLNGLAPGLDAIDWSKEQCVWTFDTRVDEVLQDGEALTLRCNPEEGTGLRLWFFEKPTIRDVRKLKFE